MKILVVSCYELGHQPLAAASTLGFLERAGYDAQAADLSVQSLDEVAAIAREAAFALIAISVPMHTALRIAVEASRRLRHECPGAHVCLFGLYATLNAGHLLRETADSVLGGEIEPSIVKLARALVHGRDPSTVEALHLPNRPAGPVLGRIEFAPYRRAALPALERYARFVDGGTSHPAAAVETSRGCLHRCTHCPIPPVYGGRFFVVPRDLVLEDIRRLAQQGARHITFADPDFFNGPRHSMAVVSAMHDELPELSFDITTKIEHVLEHRRRVPELARLGCAFVVSAVESLCEEVLINLDKGHTRADVELALRILTDSGIPMRPSLLPFTPWATLEDYLDLLEWVERRDLVESLDPVQYSIRLLVPPGSLLERHPRMVPHLRGLQPERFSYAWVHPDPRMDRLHADVSRRVRGAAIEHEPAERTFASIHAAARDAAGLAAALPDRCPPRLERAAAPRLTEPWFC